MSRSCLDTNVFFHYADSDKCCHTQAQSLIHSNDPLYTSYHVKEESEKILRKRRALNKEIQKHLYLHPSLSQFTPEVELRDSERRYLKELRLMNPKIMKKRLNYLMHKFDSEIRKAFSCMEYIIPPMHYDLFELELKKVIPNMNDVRILSDSVTWCNKNKDKCKFYTRDKEDFLDKRPRIREVVTDFFMEDLLDITDLKEYNHLEKQKQKKHSSLPPQWI